MGHSAYLHVYYVLQPQHSKFKGQLCHTFFLSAFYIRLAVLATILTVAIIKVSYTLFFNI